MNSIYLSKYDEITKDSKNVNKLVYLTKHLEDFRRKFKSITLVTKENFNKRKLDFLLLLFPILSIFKNIVLIRFEYK